MNQPPMDELRKKLEERTTDLERTRANLAAAEAALREIESKNQALLDQSPDMVFVSRIDDFRFTEVNDRACQHYGYSRQEFLALDIFDLETEPPLREQIKALYDATPVGREIEVYGTNKRKDGTTFPVHVRFAKLTDVLAIANVRDITEAKQAEKILRDSQARSEALLEDAPQGIIVSNDAGVIIRVNRQSEELFGYSREELIGEFVEILVPESSRTNHINLRSRYLQDPTSRPMGEGLRLVGRRKDGSSFPLEIGLSTIDTQDGHLTLAHISDDSNRTALRESEAQFNAHLLEEKTRAEEIQVRKTQQLQTIFKIAEALAGPADFQTKAESVSSIIQDQLEADAVSLRTLDEAAGTLNLVAATGTVPGLQQALSLDQEGFGQRAFRKGSNLVIADYTRIPNQKPSGINWGLRSVCAIPLRGPDGPNGLLFVVSRRSNHFNEERVELLEAIASGISALFESARLTEDLEQTRKSMSEQRRLASVGELAAGVAHEINNPLTTILMGSELISESDLPKDTLVQLDAIANAARRAAAIVRGLLLFARQEDPRPEPLGLDSIIEHVLLLKNHDFTMNNINAFLDFEPDLPKCLVDSNQMSQVIINILNNAEDALVKYAGGGEITIKAQSTPDEVTVEIRDNGPGIEPEMLRKIFEPFYTTKEPGSGTGLGLSICYGIIQKHGGEMWANSEKGAGTSFFVRLPITDVAIPTDSELQEGI